jgi:hypothetical protein
MHNRLHNLMFLMTHCHNSALPDTFKCAKALIRTYFLLVFNTKVIGMEYSNAIVRGGSTHLSNLFAATCGGIGRPMRSDVGGAAGLRKDDGRGKK